MKLQITPVQRTQFHIGFLLIFLICAGAVAVKLQPALLHLSCPTKQIFSIPCLTCGSSRAIAALLQFEIIQAIWFNPFVVIAITTSIVLSAVALFQFFFGRLISFQISEKERKMFWRSILVLVILNYIYLLITQT